VTKADHGVDTNWQKGVIIAKSNDVLAEFGEFGNNWRSTDFNLEVLGAPIALLATRNSAPHLFVKLLIM
jgi:hypothetical protein